MSAPYYRDDMLTLHHGRALDIALADENGYDHRLGYGTTRAIEPGSVQTIITSPPYWGLRDYGVDGQLGSESTVEEYVENLVELFAALAPALADDGTLWLNLGDTYAAKARGTDAGWDKSRLSNPGRAQKRQAASLRRTGERHRGQASGIPAKNLIGVPWRVAFALQEAGWILRSDIVWSKPNPMPESVTDRPSRAHEFVFLFAKSPRYFYNAEAIAEPVTGSTVKRLAQDIDAQAGSARANGGEKTNGTMRAKGPRFVGKKYSEGEAGEDDRFRTKRGGGYENDSGLANKRDVWTVATVPFRDAHFAVYPPELIRPCILAGSRPGDTVLDPFSGSGTTGKVAMDHGRRYVGFDINAEYLDLSLRTRFAQPSLGVEVGS